MKDDVKMLLAFAAIAVALLVADRYIRIRPMMEGFAGGGVTGLEGRCGVDLPPCPFPLKCANGFCIQPTPAEPVERMLLPVLP